MIQNLNVCACKDSVESPSSRNDTPTQYPLLSPPLQLATVTSFLCIAPELLHVRKSNAKAYYISHFLYIKGSILYPGFFSFHVSSKSFYINTNFVSWFLLQLHSCPLYGSIFLFLIFYFFFYVYQPFIFFLHLYWSIIALQCYVSYNKVNQLYVYVYPPYPFPLEPPSHPPYPTPLGHHKASS